LFGSKTNVGKVTGAGVVPLTPAVDDVAPEIPEIPPQAEAAPSMVNPVPPLAFVIA
jgi:hypothetical protein